MPAGGRLGRHGAHQRRLFARIFDLLIFLALAYALEPIGAMLGLVYVLAGDAIWPGQSAGKRLFGVTVLHIHTGRAGGLWTSILRNLPLAVALLLGLLPLVALVLFPTMGLGLLLVESYLTRAGRCGRRMGDILADSYVAELGCAPGKEGTTPLEPVPTKAPSP